MSFIKEIVVPANAVGQALKEMDSLFGPSGSLQNPSTRWEVKNFW